MKKVLVCALAALFLMATCLTAFATETTWTTTTAYTTDGKVTVTTNVTDATDGDMLTYLAYQDVEKDGDIDDDDIIYIDQQTYAEGATTKFEYTTEKDAWIGTIVKSGSSSASVTSPYTTTLEGRDITVTLAGKDTGSYSFTLANTGASTTVTTLTTANTWSVADAYKDYVTFVDGYFVITDTNAALTDGTTITITTEKKYEYTPSVAEGTIGKVFKVEENDKEIEKLTVFGEVKTDVADDNVRTVPWGGILVTTDSTIGADANAFVNGAENVKSYAALARTGDANGYKFAVQLVNETETDDLTTKSHWARIYSVDAANEYAYGDIISFIVE